jgi:hypothetical protein
LASLPSVRSTQRSAAAFIDTTAAFCSFLSRPIVTWVASPTTWQLVSSSFSLIATAEPIARSAFTT